MPMAYFRGKRARACRERDNAMLIRACVQALEPRTLLSSSIQPAVAIVVNTTVDETNGSDGFTSLREAVTQANGAGGGTITFDPSVVGGTITLSLGNISVGNSVTISGPASRSLTISGGSGGALEVASGAGVSMSDFVVSGTGTAFQIDSTGQASLQDVTMSGGTLDNGSLAFSQSIDDTAAGSITGSGSVSKTGTGTLTLTGSNNYTGGTVVNGGVLAGSTAALNGNITTTNPGTLTFDQSTLTGNTGTFNGALSGTGAMHVLGPSSTVQLGATTTLANSGTTLLDAGTTLVASGINDLSSSSAFTVNGTLNLGGFAQTIGSLSGAATGLVYNVSTQSNLTATLTAGGDNTSTAFAGILENVPAGSLNGGKLAILKAGSGALTLSGTNIFSAGLTLSAGQLNVNSASAIGTGTFTINGGTTLDNTTAAAITLSTNNAQVWSGDFTFAGTRNLSLGTGAVPLSASRIVTVTANTLTVGGVISGAFSLTKAGAGALTLSGANSYSAGTNLNAGQLNINNATAIGSGAFNIANGTTFDNTSGAPITLSNNNAQNWNGDFTFGGTNNLNLGTANVALPASRIVTVNAAGTLFVGGIISGGFGLTKAGTGTLSLSAANTYSAGTVISGGVLVGSTTSLHGSIFDNSVLSFDQTIGSVTSGTFTGSVSGSGELNFLNGIVTLAAGTLLRNFGSTIVTGTLVGPATSGTNAFSNLSSYTVNGTMDLGGASQTIGSLQGSGMVYHFQPSGQPALVTLTLGVDNSSNSSTPFTGLLLDTAPASGNGGLLAVNKSGTGTFTVTGANTFTGGLTVAGGVFGVGPTNTNNDPMGAGAVTLNGGNLALNGRLGTSVQQLVPTNGYNQDVIVEVGAANAQAATTIAYDGTYVWYEHGYTGSGTTGLPANGSTFTSAFNPSVSFQLQPYNGSNVAFINGGNGNVTLALNTPASFSTLNFLAAAASGAATMSAVLNFSDSSTAFTQFTVSDWFNGAQAAVTAGGRIARNTTATVTLTTNNPRLYEYDYAVPAIYQTKKISSITFNETSGNQLGIFALSGAASVVQPSQSYPNAIQVLSNAAIDVEGSMNATLGNLTMSASTLSLTGPSGANLAFGPVTMNVGSQFNAASSTNLSLGAITGGSNTLTKLGAGTLTLNGPDTYGSTTVSTGTLVATGSTSLPNTALSIGPAGTAQLKQNPSAFTANIASLNISAGGKLDLGNNKMFINYGSSSDPIATIRGYLANGYNNGAWTGTSNGGNILSTRAAANAAQTTAIGYADSADGLIAGQPANTVELMYTLYGDTTLTASVGFNDFTRMTQHWNQTSGGAWDTGDFNYDGSVNMPDFTLMSRTYNTSLGSQAQPATTAATSTTAAPSSGAATHHHRGNSKHPRKHRR